MNISIEQRVIAIVAKVTQKSPEDIHLSQRIEDVCADSLDQVSLLFDLEEAFDVDIPDDARNLNSIQDIVNGIKTLLAQKQEVAV